MSTKSADDSIAAHTMTEHIIKMIIILTDYSVDAGRKKINLTS